jgi:hypothetical protein
VAIVVILVLGILWAAVLLPPILRARAEGGGGSALSDGIGEFMSTVTSAFGRGHGSSGDGDLPAMQPLMGPVGPVASMGAARSSGGMSHAQKRRRDVLIGLLVAVGITLVMALFSGGNIMFLVLNLLADACLGVYVFLLLQMKSRQQHARRPQARPVAQTGRHLRSIPSMSAEPSTPSRGEPALLLRRTASY